MLIYFRPQYHMPDKSFEKLMTENGQSLTLIQGPPMGVRTKLKEGEGPLDGLGHFIRLIFES